jgi:tetratricopeptide (TPR) repeat protein
MGQPCQRMPVGGVSGVEGPDEALPGQSYSDMGIFQDIPSVVVVDELVIAYLPVNRPDGDDQEEACQCFIFYGQSHRRDEKWNLLQAGGAICMQSLCIIGTVAVTILRQIRRPQIIQHLLSSCYIYFIGTITVYANKAISNKPLPRVASGDLFDLLIRKRSVIIFQVVHARESGECLKKQKASMRQIRMEKISNIRKTVPGESQAAGGAIAGCPGDSGTSRNRKSLIAAAVAVLTFAVYLPALQDGFVWDDVQYITRNSFIRSINGNLFKTAFLTFQADNWHPLTWISHALDYAVWGLNPLGHHLTNIILHAINTFLVVLLVVRLMEQASGRRVSRSAPHSSLLTPDNSHYALVAAGITGALFGLHPLHVESVAWISERKDLLCALFFLLSVMKYVKYADRGEPGAGKNVMPPDSSSPHLKVRGGEGGVIISTGGRGSYASCKGKWHLFSLGFFILALMSKPMAVTLPIVLLLLDWYPFKRIYSLTTFRSAVVEKLPFFALTLVSSVLTVLAQKAGGAMGMMQPVPLSTRLLVGARSLVAYLGKMMAPVHLVPYYPYPDNVSLVSMEYLSSVVLVIGITLFCVVIARKQKVWLLAWSYFVVTLLPVLGIIQVGNQSMADRYTYLPGLGPFFIIGLAAAALFEKVRASLRAGFFLKTAGGVAAVVLLASMSYATIQQIRLWRNNVTFWKYVISEGFKGAAESSRSAMAHNNLGLAYASEGRWDYATVEFQTALRLKPDYVEPYYNLGVAYASQGRLDDAIAEYQRALRLKPDSAGAHNNLGIAYASQGRLDRAIAEFQITSRLKPGDAEPHMNLGIAYASQGRLDDAIAEYQRALRLKPDSAGAHYNLGNAYASQGQWDRAIAEYRATLRLNPDFRQADQRLNDIISRQRQRQP